MPRHRGQGRSARRAWIVAAALLLAVAGAQGGVSEPPTAVAGDLPLESVHAGMQGYGLTAGPDNVLERFPVRVLAIQQDAGPGFPLVLVRASGPFIEASGGVAAGMSGSPVYLATDTGPRLLGAIGYVFPSADHRLAMVTPIGVMREAATGATDGAAPGPVAVAGLGVAVPVDTPVLLSGVGTRAAAQLAGLFDHGGVTPFPVQASGSLPPGQAPPYRLEPGSAISVELVRGDVTIGAVGTVTAIDGATVLAFGHPLLGIGRVALPLAPAYVTAMVSSSVVPFKLANSGQQPLGTISQDRPAAIAGSLGDGPGMIPATLTVQAPAGTTTYHLELAADERLYPALLAAASQELLDRSLAATSGGYAQVGWEIDLAGGQQLNLVEQADDPTDIAKATAGLIAAPLQTLAANVFRAPGLQGVKVNVQLQQRRHDAEIADVVAENPEVEAGTSVVAHVRLQPYRSEAIVKTLSVPIPAGTAAGSLKLTFRGGSVKPEDASAVTPKPADRPRSFPELLEALKQHPQASELIVEMPAPDGGTRRLARLALPFVVSGSQTLEVTVVAATAPAEGATPSGDGSSPPPAPEAAPPDLATPPGATPPPPPEGPKPNGGGPSGGTS